MGFVFGLLTSPISGPVKGVHWLAKKVAEAAEGELLDEDQVRVSFWNCRCVLRWARLLRRSMMSKKGYSWND